MLVDTFENNVFDTQIECRYLLHVPEIIDDTTLLIVALHGYGSNPSDLLRLTLPVVGRQHLIASLQGPNQHYALQPGADARAAYNWGVRQHWQSAVAVHHQMVRQVLVLLRQRFGIGPERSVLLGFSQPVGLNYRFVGTYPSLVRGVIGLCGGIPRDWEESHYQPVDAAILHIARDEDEFYPLSVVEGFADRLGKRASDVEFHVMAGGHRFPSKARILIEPWIQRVFQTKK